jgi:hypothetical protein
VSRAIFVCIFLGYVFGILLFEGRQEQVTKTKTNMSTRWNDVGMVRVGNDIYARLLMPICSCLLMQFTAVVREIVKI